MSSETPTTPKRMKEVFQMFLSELIEEEAVPVHPIPTRTNVSIDESQLAMLALPSLDHLSDESICNLYSFEVGVRFLQMHVEELIERELLMYMFSSPFVSADQLLELLHDPVVLAERDGSFLDHLLANPNIYES